MASPLTRASAHVYALMRIVAGGLFACHGAQKLLGAFGAHQQPLPSLMGLAGTVELAGGAMIAIGLFTSAVALLASGQMAVAYFLAHASAGVWPIENGGELALIYGFTFLFMATAGSGSWSVDAMRAGSEASTAA